MLTDVQTFSGFSVNNYEETKDFYQNKLGLEIEQDQMGLHLHLIGQNPIFVYEKSDHIPASYTVLNFVVDDIDTVVDDLTQRGVVFEIYNSMPGSQDSKGILHGKQAKMGPDIAWFKDPSGNILSVLSN
jgi:catechol 2,3-dioxygenase-like lactoylglutathione lyase family enzyme